MPGDAAARQGFSLLVCQDILLLHEHVEQLLGSFAAKAGSIERHIFWGDEDPPPQFWEKCNVQGLFGNACAVIVRQAQLWPAAVWKKISRLLARPSEHSWPIFCLEVGFEKGKFKIPAHIAKLPCMAFAQKQGWLWQNEGLNERNISQHVRKRAGALGIAFEPDALAQFCASVPPDAQVVENELAKLGLLLEGEAGKAVTGEMLGTAPWNPDCNIFGLLREMEKGNLAGAWKELVRNREGEGLLFPLLALLARDLRQMWQIQAGESIRLYPAELNAKRQLAARLGARRLAEGIWAVADAEFRVKSGQLAADLVLEELIARMALLFKGEDSR